MRWNVECKSNAFVDLLKLAISVCLTHSMKIVRFSKDPDINAVADALCRGAIIVDLNHVFAVVALPNERGAESLSVVKNRKPGKCYGSLITDVHPFLNSSFLDPETKSRLTHCMVQGILNDAFVRVPWGKSNNPHLTLNGTHQGLKTTEPILSFCRLIEQQLIRNGEGFMMENLICSSANISGDPRGSITERNDAIQFGEDRRVNLFVEFDFPKTEVESGSFPIFSFQNMSFSVARTGPKCHEIQSQLLQNGFSQVI